MEEFPLKELGEEKRYIIGEVRRVREKAYTPYSSYDVGAILRTSDGNLFKAHNVEFMMYSDSVHAEKIALINAVQNGYTGQDDYHLLVLSSKTPEGRIRGAPPCGLCLQSMKEFCPDDLEIISDYGDKIRRWKYKDLLPGATPSEDMDL